MSTPTTRAEEIAAKLTEAQAWALRCGSDQFVAQSTGAACRCALQRKGLVVDRMYSHALTPLGHEVRRILTQSPKGPEQ